MLEQINYYFSVITKPLLLNLFLIFLVLNIFSIFRTIRLESKLLMLIAYGLIIIAFLGLLLFVINFNENKERFLGNYAIISWFMVLTHCLAPFLLLIKKFQQKLIAFLIVLFLMNFGRIMELFTLF